jgi:hypothetical protein
MKYKPAEADLKKGDVVSIAYTNTSYLCFFDSYSSAGNARFYMIDVLASRLRWVENQPEGGNKRKLFRDYINTHGHNRIHPVDVSKLPEERQKQIKELYFKLVEKGIL